MVLLVFFFRTTRITLHCPFHGSSLSNHCWMGCGRHSAASRPEVLLVTSSWTRKFSASFTTACDNPCTLKSMSISSSWVNDCPLTGLHLSCLICVYVFVCVFVFICLQIQQTLAHNSGWMVVHPQISPVLEFLVPSRPTRHLFRSPEWKNLLVVHPRVSPFLIIGFLVLFGFVGCPSCFQRLLNLILASNYLRRKPLEEARWHIHFLVLDFSRVHHNNFRETISWECFVKDDGITLW